MSYPETTKVEAWLEANLADAAAGKLSVTALDEANNLNEQLAAWEAWEGGRGGRGPYYALNTALGFASLALRTGDRKARADACCAVADTLEQSLDVCV